MKVEEESMTIRKVRSWRSWKYKERSPTPSQQWVHTTVLAKYDNLVVNGRIVLMAGLGGNRRRL